MLYEKKIATNYAAALFANYKTNRLLSKPASGSQGFRTYGAENRSVLDVREDLSTEVTTQLASEVEFRERSNEDTAVVYDGLNMFWEIISFNERLYSFFRSPIFPISKKYKIINDLAKKLKLDDKIVNFLKLVIKNSRIEVFPEILEYFYNAHTQKLGIKQAEIVSTSQLTKKELLKLQKFLEDKIGQKVLLRDTVDPSLKGGILIKYDSMLIDCSIKGALDKIERVLDKVELKDV